MPVARCLSAVVVVLLLAACAPDEEEPQAPDEPPTQEPEPEAPEPEQDAEGAEEPEAPRLDVALSLSEVARLDAPTAGAVGPDGVLYVAERGGTVRPLTDQGAGSPVVDLADETSTDGERGLLGLAFAEDGAELYLSYTDLDGGTVVDAVAVDDGGIDADERRTVLTLDQPFANHNGGDVQVGPDGMLYLGLGDGGGGGDPLGAGQDLGTLLGSLLRIDPAAGQPYGIPDENPFLDEPAAKDEILVYGLRNPWRFSFDPETDELWIADVGQDAREEINVLAPGEAAGANLGWSRMEGTLEFSGDEPDDHVPPVHEYETTSQRCAITGGYVYRGQAVPELRGAYVFSDYCEGVLRAIVVEDGEVTDEAVLDVEAGSVASFARDADGELYVLDLGGSVGRLGPAD